MKEIVTLCVCVLIALVLAIVIVKYVGQKTEVSGDSMNDTLVNGQQLIIDKLTYRNHEPERYDIVVFPESDTTTFVKRIIGLPGETVSIKEGFVYVDGQMLSDDVYGKESITKDNYYRLEDSSVTLGENEYFVMGDNRNNSKDSRDYEIGNVTKDQFIGKVVFRIWPIKDIGVVK
ncbi:MAG: signal peptidase I [Lachnospira sp.]|nr:signal peptidase I [Lachnospira sp.]